MLISEYFLDTLLVNHKSRKFTAELIRPTGVTKRYLASYRPPLYS